jgi:hypothetical protein
LEEPVVFGSSIEERRKCGSSRFFRGALSHLRKCSPRKRIISPSSGCQYVLLKYREIYARLHGVHSQKPALFKGTFVRIFIYIQGVSKRALHL